MTPGELPASAALAEADPASLSEAIDRFDRSVSSGSGPDAAALAQIITALREQRVRWEASDVARPQRQPRASGAKQPLGLRVAGSLEDLGL